MANLFSLHFLSQGGWVAQVLAALTILLWYCIGFRFFNLKTKALAHRPESIFSEDSKSGETDYVLSALQKMKGQWQKKVNQLEQVLYQEKIEVLQQLRAHRQSLKAIVIVAPLLGLLGTVQGMIETFDSLQDSALFSQSGGIAGGISQALITTQMGLVVAIPGLLIGRKLDQKERAIEGHVDQVIGQLLIKEYES